MKYIITTTQFHTIIYNHFDRELSGEVKKEINPYDESGRTYSLELHNEEGKNLLSFYYFPKTDNTIGGERDIQDSSGSLHVHYRLYDELKGFLPLRKSGILNIIADWFTDKYNLDVDEVSIYPKDDEEEDEY